MRPVLLGFLAHDDGHAVCPPFPALKVACPSPPFGVPHSQSQGTAVLGHLHEATFLDEV